MTVWPLASTTRAPSGARTLDDGPTSAMRPLRMTMVWAARGAAPVPSMTVALVTTTTGSATATYWRTPAESWAAVRWACSAGAATRTAAARTRGRMGGGRLDGRCADLSQDSGFFVDSDFHILKFAECYSSR